MVKETYSQIVSKRVPQTHKGDYGHVLVIAGSIGMTGAAYLCCQAALISGSGLVTLAIPKSLNSIMEVKLTEVITKPQEETKKGTLSIKAYGSIVELAKVSDVVAMGCGLTTHPEVKSLIQKLISSLEVPMVLDADALNAISDRIEILKEKKKALVLTPHPGEMARILKTTTNAVQKERLKIAKEFAARHNVVVVLKGHDTVVAKEDGSNYVNTTGNPGMASAGMGDVLAGMIASFIGQGIDPFNAAKLGVYLHGLSADLAASKEGQVSLIASDVLDYIPEAIRKI